jgi:hypothetical protein
MIDRTAIHKNTTVHQTISMQLAIHYFKQARGVLEPLSGAIGLGVCEDIDSMLVKLETHVTP